VWLAFFLKFSKLQGPQTETFLGKLFCNKKKAPATWQFLNFSWQHPEIFFVHVACPGVDFDEPSPFFGKLFCKEIDTDKFLMKNL
jgi:hypothetical protein